jgi:hypothetical protein
MGLGFQTSATLRRKKAFGLLAAMVPPKDVAAAIQGCTRGTPLEQLASLAELDEGHGYALTLHPAAEALYLEIDGETVTASAKTSNVGPGYHAFLVAALDSVQTAFGFKWEWREEDDETGFARHRDFVRLQSEMAKQFKAVSKVVSDRIATRGVTDVMLSMPVDCRIKTIEEEVLTPLGPVTPAELRRWGNLDGVELARAAATCSPWWGTGFDGSFYRGLALHSMWMDMRWATPLDDPERRTIQQTLAWCAEAARMQAAPPLPASAVRELRALLETPHLRELPREGGIGYRRRQKRVQLTGGWHLWVPGDLEEALEDENTTVVLWNNDLTIRGTSISATPKDGSDMRHAETTAVDTTHEFEPTSEGFTLQVTARKLSAKGERVCLLTFWMSDAEQRGLAEQIAATLSHENGGPASDS